MSDMDFEHVVDQSRNALDAIAKGDPTRYLELYSAGDDITLANPFGGFGKGRADVFERIELAASFYRDGQATSFEPVAKTVGSDIAYTVEIERFETKVGGQQELSQIALRVTCVYRREAGGWKLVHRHADPRVDRQSLDSVIQH
jgi:ketosteroid isomerase-like protein